MTAKKLKIKEITSKELKILSKDGKLPKLCPKTIYVWKKAIIDNTTDRCLVLLSIAKGTKTRFHHHPSDLHRRKCRAEKAKVLGFYEPCTEKKLKHKTSVIASHNMLSEPFYYKVGKIVKPRSTFDNSNIICGTGIHFFLRRNDAEKYPI